MAKIRVQLVSHYVRLDGERRARPLVVHLRAENDRGSWEEVFSPDEAEAFVRGLDAARGIDGLPGDLEVVRSDGPDLVPDYVVRSDPPEKKFAAPQTSPSPVPIEALGSIPAHVLGPGRTPPKAPPISDIVRAAFEEPRDRLLPGAGQ